MHASNAAEAENNATGNQVGNTWPAKIIFGEPKGEDEFGGRGHERSARALADGIRQIAERTSGRQRAGGAIGLEGAWGSGKSTVIDIAKQKYLGPEYCMFTFDLWRHQSDDFRRSLLEQLIMFVREEFNPKDKDGKHIHGKGDPRPKVDLDIDSKHDEIKNRKSVTTTTSSRRLSLFAAILIIFLPLMPLLYAALTRLIIGTTGAVKAAETTRENVQSSPVDAILSFLVNPWMLGIVTYLLASIFLILAAYCTPFAGKKNFHGKMAWFQGGASRLLTLSERDSNNEVEQKIRDESPTTVEFRTVFEGILVALQKANRHIIFVLDNIDRIPAADLSKTWAEVRSLVAGNGGMSKQLGSVVAVVPYDKDHVGREFPPVKVPKLVQRDGGDDGEYVIDRENGIVLETDIFEKTFDRIVKVSAPVPSDWKHFLMARIAEAGFSGVHGSDHTEKLFRLLQFKLQREGVYPTPRRIIAYVNDIGGLWVQWADSSIPIETVGLYVLHKAVFDRDPGILNKSQPVHIRFARIVDDPDYAKHLAALAFNVDPALANQVRLGIPITAALLGPDEKSLVDLSKSDGFYEIFQDVLRERLVEWSKDSPESISRAANHVDKMELPAESEDVIWQIFGDAVDGIEKLDYTQEGLDGLYTIVRRQKRYKPEAVGGRIREKFEAAELEEGDKDLFSKGMGWYRVMQSLAKAISSGVGVDRGQVFWETQIPSSLPIFNLGAISANDPASSFKFSNITFGCDEAALSKELLKMAEVNPTGYDFAIGVVGQRLTRHFASHFEAIATRLDSTEPDDQSIRLIHAIAKFMAAGSQATAILSAFAAVRSGALLNYAKWAAESGEDDNLAVALLVLATVYDGALAKAPIGTKEAIAAEWYNSLLEDAANLGDVPQQIAAYAATNHAVSTWLGWAVISKTNGGLYCEVIRAVTALRWVWLRDQVMVAKHFDRIKVIVDKNGAAFFLRHFSDYQGRVKKEFGGSASRQVPASMIEALAELDENAVSKQILELIQEHLASLHVDEWLEALTTAGHNDVRLLVGMREHTGRFELRSPAFIEGMVRVSLAVLSGDFDPAPLATNWRHVFGAIPISQYIPLRAQIVSGMRSANVSATGSIAFVKYFGTVAQKMRFSIDPATADMALSHFLWHLANSDDTGALEYLDTQKKEITAILKAASSDEVREAYQEARRRENDSDDE